MSLLISSLLGMAKILSLFVLLIGILLFQMYGLDMERYLVVENLAVESGIR